MNDVLPQRRIGDLIVMAHRLRGLLPDVPKIQTAMAEVQDLLDEASDEADDADVFAGCVRAIKGKLWLINRELNRQKTTARNAGEYATLESLETAHRLSKQFGQDMAFM